MNEKQCLSFELEAAQSVYDYIMDRHAHIEGIAAEIFAGRCVEAAFGPLIRKQIKKNVPRVDITETVQAQIKKKLRSAE